MYRERYRYICNVYIYIYVSYIICIYIYIIYIYRYRSNISTRCSLIMCWVVRATDQELDARGLLTGNHCVSCLSLSVHPLYPSIYSSFFIFYLSTLYLCWFIDISISFIPYPYAQLFIGLVEGKFYRKPPLWKAMVWFPPFSIPKPLNFLYNISPCFLAKSV